MKQGRIAALAASLAIFAGCSRGPETLPDLKFPTLSAKTSPSLASCPTPKCLTVYVAPWCGYCRAATPIIVATRRYLEKHGVSTRVIVGMDEAQEVLQYASDFGPDTWLDAAGAYRVKGVPHFIVSNSQGQVLRDVGGAPLGIQDEEQFASYYGLP